MMLLNVVFRLCVQPDASSSCALSCVIADIFGKSHLLSPVIVMMATQCSLHKEVERRYLVITKSGFDAC